MILSYLKKIFKIIIWPIVFAVGQFFIQTIFTMIFNVGEIKTLNRFYPSLSSSEIDEKFIKITQTIDYQNRLKEYLNNNVLWILFASMIVIVPIAYIIYKKCKNNRINKIKSKGLLIVLILFPIFYNCFIYLTGLNPTAYRISELSYLIQVISSGICGPILEELIYRGILFNKLKTFNTEKISILLSSFIFSLMHSGMVNLVYAFIIGIMLSYVYSKTNNLKLSIMLHSICNIVTIFLVPVLLIKNIILNISLMVVSFVLIIIILLLNRRTNLVKK